MPARKFLTALSCLSTLRGSLSTRRNLDTRCIIGTRRGAVKSLSVKHLLMMGLMTGLICTSACATVPQPLPQTGQTQTGGAQTGQTQTEETSPPIVRPAPSGEDNQISETDEAAETITEAADAPLPPRIEIFEAEDNPSGNTTLENYPSESPSQEPSETPAPKDNLVVALPYWAGSDVTPALAALQRSCKSWADSPQDTPLSESLPKYGTLSDWASACAAAQTTSLDYAASKDFFERSFTPVTLSGRNHETGLMTGYYQPEINVKRRADAYYNEPILAVPKSKSVQNLPRADISASSARVIAYGRPLDVFFMQIQGSGHLRYENGATIRAAYAGNNGHSYRSIGSVLIARGELTKDRSSKADIENWMADNGPAKARELMDENPRYIYFVEQRITPGEGPNGAMRVPLTAMGSMAVDPRYHPYGSLMWLETTLPQFKGDYKGTPSGLLLAAQDTGKAIRGAMRGDIFFGSGTAAGDLAGVMKHRAVWTALLPNALAARVKDSQNSIS